MLNYINHKSLKALSVGCLFVLFSFTGHAANYLTGPTNVAANSQQTYTYDNGLLFLFPNWAVTGGTIVSTSQNATAYTAVVQWGSGTSGSVTFISNNISVATLNVAFNGGSGGGGSVPTGQSNENYIYTITPSIASTDVSLLDNDDMVESVTYFDGLGRPMQSVGIRAGGQSQDIVTHIGYDGYGRQDKDYLPYAGTTNGGLYRTDALTATGSFYNTAKYENTLNPFSERHLEASPLNRVLEQGAPGADWLVNKTADTDHTIKFDYKTNTSTTEVRRYEVTLAASTVGTTTTYTPTLVLNTTINNGYYTANQLYKTITKDENWTSGTNRTTEEFKDKQGRVVLKRTYNNSIPHDTYYVYDDHENLAYVLPPKAEPQTALPDATKLAELCYQYKYDQRNRLVEKKVPGKGSATDWEEIVYNRLDQPILTRDPNLKVQTKWLFTKYDAFGRVAYTGFIASGSSRVTLQNAANGTTLQYVTKSPTSTSIAGTTIYYSNDTSVYPTSNISELHTINYYDDYTFDKDGLTLPSTADGQPIINYNDANKPLTKGLATGSKVRVLGTANWTTTLTGYDVKGRPIYTVGKNSYLSTTDTAISKLDFVGKVDRTTTTHAKTGQSTITTVDTFTYDHMGRLIEQKNKINALAEEIIVENTYDELGQLVTKGVGGKTIQSRFQTVDYAYNIRGWLKQINDPASLGADLFAFKINYNTVAHGATALYNGNIAETEWKTQNDNLLRWYKYGYDNLNRITSGIDNTADTRYSLSSVAYDKNGNIANLTRRGQTNVGATTFGVMDQLTYTYQANSNKLTIVSDAGNDTFGFKDDQIGTGTDITTDYTYDANGNLTSDTNKGITSILWNHLNMPSEIKFNNSNTQKINYTYTANGIKVRKVVNDGGSVTTTDYAGAYQYVNNNLEFIRNFEDGYVYPKSGGGFGYVYYYTDQLDNIRLMYSDDNGDGTVTTNEIIKESHFYPFGLVHKGYNGTINPIGSSFHKYDYQNQERQDELGLNWLQFKYRMQDPAIGRFVSIDPLAEDYVHNSTYAFAENKVIKYNELEGLEITLNKFDRLSYDNKSWLGKAATFVGNAAISVANGGIDAFNYAGDLDRADQAAGGFGQGAGTKVVDDASAVAGAVSDYAQNTTLSEFGSDLKDVATNVETYENLAGAFIAAGAASKISKFGTISELSNPVPSRLARVIPGDIANPSSLGVTDQVFVTAANDIKGLSATQIAEKLTIPKSSSGFNVIEFDTPSSGLSTPIKSNSPGFIGGGKTAGGAREFNLPNLKLSELKGLNFEIKF